MPLFFMAAVNPPAEWSTDQTLLPESLVDYFVPDGEGGMVPISVASAEPEPEPEPEPDAEARND